ncbi:hypothetical protein [Streptomyces rubiginosohelvolus]|uniref:hypothetical protein n=1 Tax=Streptomyces rubiginosohelvolus TaxID=67362 RepID=UPI00364F1FEB
MSTPESAATETGISTACVDAAREATSDGVDVEAPTEARYEIGEEARNRGTVVTVNKVREVSSTTFDGADKQAGADAKYVILETVVRNDTKASMDLTCSLADIVLWEFEEYDLEAEMGHSPRSPVMWGCRAPRLQGHNTPPLRCPGRDHSLS